SAGCHRDIAGAPLRHAQRTPTHAHRPRRPLPLCRERQPFTAARGGVRQPRSFRASRHKTLVSCAEREVIRAPAVHWNAAMSNRLRAVGRAWSRRCTETFCALGAQMMQVAVPDVTGAVIDWAPACALEAAVAHQATYPARPCWMQAMRFRR